MNPVVARAAGGRTVDPDAHRWFVQGRFLTSRFSVVDLERAIDYLPRAVDKDPTYALAWAWMGRACVLAGGFGEKPVAETYERARAAARRALELDPDLGEGYIAKGMVEAWYDWNWENAKRSYDRALELLPDNPDALSFGGLLTYVLTGSDVVLERARRAIAVDPLNIYAYSVLGRACRWTDRLEEAEWAFRKALEISPTALVQGLLILTCAELGRLDEAQQLLETIPVEWARLYTESIVSELAGDRQNSDRALARLTEGHREHCAYQIAVAHAMRGEHDAAFTWLDRAIEQRDSGISVAKPDRLLRSLHGDPRWAAFLAKINLKP